MFGYITTASTSTIVHTVSRCICARSCAIGTASTVCARSSSNRLRANASAPGGRGALPHPDRDHARRQQQHVAALDGRRPRLVRPPHAQESRVVRIDQVGQRRLAHARGQRQRRDRHPRPDPERRVAGEQQIRQRVDDEVAAVVHPPHQRQFTAAERQLVERHPRHQHRCQRRRIQRAQVRRKLLRQRQSQPSRIDRSGDAVHAGRPALGQRLGQQIGEQQHLDAARAQQRGERIVLLLRLGHPGQPVEQQRVVVARRQPLQFGAGPVQDDDPQPCRPRNRSPTSSHLAP